jgi:hypothetical protein
MGAANRISVPKEAIKMTDADGDAGLAVMHVHLEYFDRDASFYCFRRAG